MKTLIEDNGEGQGIFHGEGEREITFSNVEMGVCDVTTKDDETIIIGTTGLAPCLGIVVFLERKSNNNNANEKNLIATSHFDSAESCPDAQFEDQNKIVDDSILVIKSIVDELETKLELQEENLSNFEINKVCILGCQINSIATNFINALKNLKKEIEEKADNAHINDFTKNIELFIDNLSEPPGDRLEKMISTECNFVALEYKGRKTIQIQYNIILSKKNSNVPTEIVPIAFYSIDLDRKIISEELKHDNLSEVSVDNPIDNDVEKYIQSFLNSIMEKYRNIENKEYKFVPDAESAETLVPSSPDKNTKKQKTEEEQTITTTTTTTTTTTHQEQRSNVDPELLAKTKNIIQQTQQLSQQSSPIQSQPQQMLSWQSQPTPNIEPPKSSENQSPPIKKKKRKKLPRPGEDIPESSESD